MTHPLLNRPVARYSSRFSGTSLVVAAACAALSLTCMGQDIGSEVEAALKSANECIAVRDFSCADLNLRLAAQRIKTDGERAALAESKSRLAAEKRLAAAEQSARAPATGGLDNSEIDDQLEASEKRRRSRLRQSALANERQKAEEDAAAAEANPVLAIVESMKQKQREIAEINAMHNKHTEALNRIASEKRKERTERAKRESEVSRVSQAKTAGRTRENSATQQERDSEAGRSSEDARVRMQREQEQAERTRERAADEAEARTQRAQEKADRLAKQQADKDAAEKAKADYLVALLQKTTLRVRNCYGKYSVVGVRPSIKPELVACVDVHYRARCTDGHEYTRGVGKNFVGMGTDCFTGDTYELAPKPMCPVEKVQVEATAMRPCGE